MPRRANKKPTAAYESYYELIFRGYTDDDKVSRKDDSKIKEFKQVCKSDDLFGVFRVGVVMVDVDNGNDANIIQRMLDDCNVSYLYQDTTRGKHFFFYHGAFNKKLSDRSHIFSAVGIECDYKCYSVDGTKLSKTLESGEVQARPLIPSINWDDKIEDLPYFLAPVNAKDDFVNLKDCRNETFYIYILKLLRYGLDKEQTRQTIRLINNYVLSRPLTDRELETILRDESFPTNNEIFVFKHGKDKTAKLDYELLAKHLIEKYDICRIEGSIYARDNGLYTAFNQSVLDKITINTLTNTTINMRKEVMKYIEVLARDGVVKKTDSILFKNGVLDLKTKQLREVRVDDMFFNRVDVNYINNAEEDATIDKFFNDISCDDLEIKSLLFEMCGYTLLRGNRHQVFFWLDGEGSNGKSTLIDLIRYSLGAKNITNLSMKGLNAKFGLGSIKNALVNVSGDESTKYVEESELLKNLTGGDIVKVESKGVDHSEMIYRGNLIFCGNGIPKFRDSTSGLNRRIIIIPMLKNFELGGKDVNFKDKLLTPHAAEYFISQSINGLYRVLEHGFTQSSKSESRKEEFVKDNNPILQFLDDYEIKDDANVKDVYLAYRVWCEENGITGIMNSMTFSRNITKRGYKRKDKKDKNRKKYYVFVKEPQISL